MNGITQKATQQNEINYKLVRKSAIGDLFAVQELVKHGANIHFNNDLALVSATKENHTSVAIFLLNNGAIASTYCGAPLVNASYYGNYELVKHLVAHDASVGDVTHLSVKYATKGGHLDILKFFATNGILKESMYEDLMHLATIVNQMHVVEYLSNCINQSGDIKHN